MHIPLRRIKSTLDQLKRALLLSEQIQILEAEVASILGGIGPAQESANVHAEVEPKASKGRGKGKRSPEARAKMAAAQKARWAKTKGEAASDVAPKADKKAKKKRVVSDESRAKMAAAQIARRAKERAA